LRVGLVGAGNIAGHHLPAYLEHREAIELVAVCDLDADRARRRAEEAGASEVYTDAETMIREAAVDALDRANPSGN
jgi:predicted dehydrogenase